MTATTHSASANNTATDAGIVVTAIACNAGGDNFTPAQNGKANDYYFVNGSGASITVTLKHQGGPVRVPGLGTVTPTDKALAIGPGATGLFRIESADLPEYLDASGMIDFTYSAVTSLSVMPVQH